MRNDGSRKVDRRRRRRRQECQRQQQRRRKIRMISRKISTPSSYSCSSSWSSSKSVRHPVGLGGRYLRMLLILLGCSVGVVASQYHGRLGMVADAAHDRHETIDHGRRQLHLALIDLTLSFESLHTPSLPELAIQDLQESIKVVLERELSAAAFKMTPSSTTTTNIQVINMDLYTTSQASQAVNRVINVDNTSWYNVQVSTDLILEYNFQEETTLGTFAANTDTNNLSNGNIIRTILDQQSTDLLRLLILLDEKRWGTVDTIRLIPSSTTTGGIDYEYDEGYDDAGDNHATEESSDSSNRQNQNIPWWSNSIFIFSVAGVGVLSISIALGVVVWYTNFCYQCCQKRSEQSTQQETEADDIHSIGSKPESFSETSSSEGALTTDRSDEQGKDHSSTATSTSSSSGVDCEQLTPKKTRQPLEKLFLPSSMSTNYLFHGKQIESSKIQAVYSEDKVCDTEVLNGLRSKRESAEDKLKSSMGHISVPRSITQCNRRYALLSSRMIQTQLNDDEEEQYSTSICQSIPSTNNSNACGKSQIIDLIQKRKVIEERIKQKCKMLSGISNSTAGSKYNTNPTHQQQQLHYIQTVDQRRDTDSLSTLTAPYGMNDCDSGGRCGARNGSGGIRLELDQYKINGDDDGEEDVELKVLSSDEEDDNAVSRKTKSTRKNGERDRHIFDDCNDDDDDNSNNNNIAKGGLVSPKSSISNRGKTTKKTRTRKYSRRGKDNFDDIPAVVHRTDVHQTTTQLPAFDNSYLSTFKKAYY